METYYSYILTSPTNFKMAFSFAIVSNIAITKFVNKVGPQI